MRIAKVCLLSLRLPATLKPSPEVAVSLNSNDVQLYARNGSEWAPTETLSEVPPATWTPLFLELTINHSTTN